MAYHELDLAEDITVETDDVKIILGEYLWDHTSFRIGGAADIYLKPVSEEGLMIALEQCRRHRVPFWIFGKGTNLHAVWDRWLIDYTQLSYTEFVNYLQDRYGAEKKVWEQRTFLECLYITYDRQQQVYAYQELNDTNPYHYAYRFLRDLDESLYAAGIQLAKLLNEIYK